MGEGGGGGRWRGVGVNLQHVVVVLKLALGDLFNGEGRRDAHRRKHLRCSRREIAEMRQRQRQRQWAGTFCRIFKFFKRSSGNLADMSTCTAAVTRTSRLRASSTREMAQERVVMHDLLEGDLAGVQRVQQLEAGHAVAAVLHLHQA